MNSQKGIAQVAILLLLAAGLVSGVYLVQNKTFFTPKAATNKLVSNKITSKSISQPITPKPTGKISPSPKVGQCNHSCENQGSLKNKEMICDPGLICVKNEKQPQASGHCRNPKCPEKENCLCEDSSSTNSPAVISKVPVPSCTPRPACLDAKPPCMIAEPKSGWCSEKNL